MATKRRGFESEQQRDEALLGLSPYESNYAPAADTTAAPTKRSRGEVFTDLASGAAKGIIGGVQDLATGVGMLVPGVEDNPETGWLDESANTAKNWLQGQKSELVRSKEAELSRLIQDDNATVTDVLGYLANNKSDLAAQMVIESLGSMAIGVGGTGAMMKLKAVADFAKLGKMRAAAVGAIPEGLQSAGNVYAESGGNLEAGLAGGAFTALAGAVTPGNVMGAAARKFAGKAAGETVEGTIEDVAGRSIVGRTLGEASLRGAAARTGAAVVAETGQELLQEGGEAAATQWGKTGEIDWQEVGKQAAVGAALGGVMGGGMHPLVGEGAVGTRAAIEAERQRILQGRAAAATQAAAADPTNPTLETAADSARASAIGASTTPLERGILAENAATVAAQTTMAAPDSDSAIDAFQQGQQTSSTLRTGATVAEAAQQQATEQVAPLVQGTYDPERAEREGVTPGTVTGAAEPIASEETAPLAAGTGSPLPTIEPDLVPARTLRFMGANTILQRLSEIPPTPITAAQARSNALPQSVTLNDAIRAVAEFDPATQTATSIAPFVELLHGAQRPSQISETVWNAFVRDAQTETGVRIPLPINEIVGRTVMDTLNTIANRGSRPGRILANVLRGANNPFLNTVVRPFTQEEINRRPDARGMVTSRGAQIGDFAMNPRPGRSTESAFLHETVHALTLSWLNTVPSTDPLYQELKELMDRVRTEADIRGIEHYGTHPGGNERARMAEFMAEAFTRPPFQNFLDSIQVESGRTGWDSFVEWVARLIGQTTGRPVTAPQVNALDLALRLTQDAMDRSGQIARNNNIPPAPATAPVVEPTAAATPADPVAAARQAYIDHFAQPGRMHEGNPEAAARAADQLASDPERINDIANMELSGNSGDLIGRVDDVTIEYARALRDAAPATPVPAAPSALDAARAALVDYYSSPTGTYPGDRAEAERAVERLAARGTETLERVVSTPGSTPQAIRDYAQAVLATRPQRTPEERELEEAIEGARNVGLVQAAIDRMQTLTDSELRVELRQASRSPEGRELARAILASRGEVVRSRERQRTMETLLREAESGFITYARSRGVSDQRALDAIRDSKAKPTEDLRRITETTTVPLPEREFANAILRIRGEPITVLEPTTTPPSAGAAPTLTTPSNQNLTPAQRGAITRARNAARQAAEERLAANTDAADLINYINSWTESTRVLGRSTAFKKGVIRLMRAIGTDEARQYLINHINAVSSGQVAPAPPPAPTAPRSSTPTISTPTPVTRQNTGDIIPMLPPSNIEPGTTGLPAGETLPVPGSAPMTLMDAAAAVSRAERNLSTITPGRHPDTGATLDVAALYAMPESDLRALEPRVSGMTNTNALARAILNQYAVERGEAVPFPQTNVPPMLGSNTTERTARGLSHTFAGRDQYRQPLPATPNSPPRPELNFSTRLEQDKAAGILDQIGAFWQRVMSDPDQWQITPGEIELGDLRQRVRSSSLNADVMNELKRRYNETFVRKAREWAAANGQPDPGSFEVIRSLSPNSGSYWATIVTHGVGRHPSGNPYLINDPNRTGTGSLGASNTTTELANAPGSSDIAYRISADLSYLKGSPVNVASSLLTNNNVRRQWQSLAATLRLTGDTLSAASNASISAQGMPSAAYRALTHTQKVGANALRMAHNAFVERNYASERSNARAFSNLMINPDGVTFTAVYDPERSGGFPRGSVVTMEQLEQRIGMLDAHVQDEQGGLGKSSLVLAIITNTMATSLESNNTASNTIPAELESAAQAAGESFDGYFFSQDDAVSQDIQDVMGQLAEPGLTGPERGELNARLRDLQAQRVEARDAEDGPVDMAEVERMQGELTRMDQIGAGATIDVDGVARPLLNSEGRQIHPTREGVRNFWRWFGDSKVVDALGRPLVAYTGTSKDKDFDKFNIPKNGTWFSSDPKVASDYAKDNDSQGYTQDGWNLIPKNTASRVIPVYLRIENFYKMTDADYAAINVSNYKKAQGAFFDNLRAKGYDGIDFGGGTYVVLKEARQIKSATGNTGAFDPNETRINFSYDTVPSNPTVAASPAAQIAGTTQPVAPANPNEIRIAPGRGLSAFERLTNWIRKALQDKHITLKRILSAINDLTAYEAIDTFDSKRQASFERLVREPMANIENELREGNINRAEFETYLKMRHAREYNEHTARISPLQIARNNEITGFDHETRPGSGIKSSAADDYMAQEHSEAMLKAARAYDQMIRSLQDFAVETGLESRQTVDMWNEMFPNYTPFQRDLDLYETDAGGTGSGFSVREGISKRAMGADQEILPPMVSTLQLASRIVDRGEKARIGQTMLSTMMRNTPMFRTKSGEYRPMFKVDTMPNARTVERVRVYNVLDPSGNPILNGAGVPLEFYNGSDARAYAANVNRGARTSQATGQQPHTVRDTGFQNRAVMRHNPAYINRDNVLVIPVNGENHVLVADEQSEEAIDIISNMKNLDDAQLNALLKVANVFSRWVVGTATGYNPMFAPINFLRDIQSSAVNINSAGVPGWTKADSLALMKDSTKAVPGLLKYLWSKQRAMYSNELSSAIKPEPDSMAEWMERAKAAGGLTGIRESFRTYDDAVRSVQHLFGEDILESVDPRQRQDILERGIGRGKRLADSFDRMLEGGARNAAGKAVGTVAQGISNLNSAFELATRTAAFKAAYEKHMDAGATPTEAARRAALVSKNVSVNFNRRGTSSASMNALFPFFNAAMQGSARLAELLFEKQNIRNAQGEVEQKTRLTPAGKKVLAALPALGALQALLLAAAGYEDDQPPEHVKDRNFVIPMLDGGYLTVPMPLGLNAVFNMGRNGMEGILNPDKAGEKIVNVLTQPISAFNPLGSTPNTLLNIMPAILDTPVALLMNKDAFDRQIFKQDRDPRRPTPGFTRHKEGTSQASIGIAEAINTLTGGNDYRPGFFSPTGDQIEYVFGQMTGGIGREVGKAAQFGYESVAAPELSADRPWYKVPLAGKFVGDINSSAAVRDKLYNVSADINVKHAEYKGLLEDKKREEAAQFLKENPEVKMRDKVEAYFNAESKGRKERNEAKREGENAKVVEINTRLREKGQRLLDEIEQVRAGAR
jgi:hypothetical protein